MTAARPLGLVVLALLCLAALAPAQDEALEIFEIRNRLAGPLVPAVEPHVGPGGAVTAHGNKLIVRARRDRMDDVRRIVESLDTPARLLRLTVERSDDRSARAAEVGGAVVAGSGGVAAAVGGSHGSASQEEAQTQILQVTEGAPARLDLGVVVPITSVGIVGSHQGAAVVQDTQYASVVSGVSVVPRVTDAGSVILDLALEGGRVLDDGTFERDVVETRVSGRLGEWIEIGSAVRQLASRGSGLLGLSKEMSARDLRMRVRVDDVG